MRLVVMERNHERPLTAQNVLEYMSLPYKNLYCPLGTVCVSRVGMEQGTNVA
jgi:hypothetical protein